jgi:hypothetical protein
MIQPPEQIIQDVRSLGMRLWAEETEAGPKLLFRPKGIMPLDLFRRLVEHKPAVLALLAHEEAEIAWRAAAIRPQVPAKGPIPFLTCRAFPWTLEDALAVVEGRRQPVCLSCGAQLAEGRQVRCALCVAAIEMVLNVVREMGA